MNDILKAREAIIAELNGRHRIGDPYVRTIVKGNNVHVTGTGEIPCPVCGKGRLGYSRANNGHVHASCSTDSCVHWME